MTGDTTDLLVVILAGGEGRRIGGDKPLRLLGGRPLISHALDKARRWSSDVRLCVRSGDPHEALGCATIIDEADIEGPLGGLAAALAAARRSGVSRVLTLPCDMPFLPDDLAERLVEGLAAYQAALAESGGHLQPVCAVWRTEALDALPDYLATGRRSLIGFAEWIGFARVAWTGDWFFNVNDVADLAEAERRFAAGAYSVIPAKAGTQLF